MPPAHGQDPNNPCDSAAYAARRLAQAARTVHADPASPPASQVRLPLEQWQIRVNDVYPAYICLPDL